MWAQWLAVQASELESSGFSNSALPSIVGWVPLGKLFHFSMLHFSYQERRDIIVLIY